MSEPKRKIVVFSGFNRAKFGPKTDGVHKVLTEEWIRKRFDIWFRYTWQSILRQDYKDWVYCLCCDPAGKEITDKYFGQIKDKRFYLTYSETDQERKVMQGLAAGHDEMISVRIDSDDMYHPSALQELFYALYDTSYNWFLWQQGYGYQYQPGAENGKMKIYRPGHGSGPFFAHRYHACDWLRKGIIQECQHILVIKKRPKFLKTNRVLVGVYGGNTSTNWKAHYFRSEVDGDERDRVLQEFGIK